MPTLRQIPVDEPHCLGEGVAAAKDLVEESTREAEARSIAAYYRCIIAEAGEVNDAQRLIFVLSIGAISWWMFTSGPMSPTTKESRPVAVAGALPLNATRAGVSVTINGQRCLSNITVYDVLVRNTGADRLMVGAPDWKGVTASGRAVRAESTIPVVWVSRGEHVSGTVSFVSADPIVTLAYAKVFPDINISLTPPTCVR